MKNNRNFYFSSPYMGFVLIGITIFQMAFSKIPMTGVINRAEESANADIKVLGTSNLHDWTMENKDVTCTAKFSYASANASAPDGLSGFGFTFPVHNLKSGKSGMDSRAYDAMKAKTQASIVFAASASTIVPGATGQFSVKSSGNLTIAGVTKPVSLTAACVVNADGSITCKGTDRLLMSDYQISPPTYMLGTLKTGDALTIDFTMIVKK